MEAAVSVPANLSTRSNYWVVTASALALVADRDGAAHEAGVPALRHHREAARVAVLQHLAHLRTPLGIRGGGCCKSI